MAFKVPNVLIFGHSFVRRLRNDLLSHFDPRTELDFGFLAVLMFICLGSVEDLFRPLDSMTFMSCLVSPPRLLFLR